MKHLNFCPKLIVISQKKRSSLEISLGFHYFSLKTSDVGKNKRKRSFYIKSVFDFLRNFCQNRQDRAPKSCPKTIQRAVSKFRDKSDPARDKGRQKSIPGLSRPFRDGWQPYRIVSLIITVIILIILRHSTTAAETYTEENKIEILDILTVPTKPECMIGLTKNEEPKKLTNKNK